MVSTLDKLKTAIQQKQAAQQKNRIGVVIVSGGMDSVTLLHDLIKRKDIYGDVTIYAISFNYGQRHNKELLCAWRQCQEVGVDHKILDMHVLNEVAPSVLTRRDRQVPEGHYQDSNMKATVVPNRNMVMLSLATAYCIGLGGDIVFYGAHGGDHAIYPDCRPTFVDAMNKVMQLCDWTKVRLEVPYLRLNKTNILTIGKWLGVDYSQTWTCYNGRDKACGRCGSCQERLEAFKNLGLVDPLTYE